MIQAEADQYMNSSKAGAHLHIVLSLIREHSYNEMQGSVVLSIAARSGLLWE